jgi:hypothetical protein
MTHVMLVMLADDYGVKEGGRSFEYETFLPAFERLCSQVTVFAVDRAVREFGYFETARRMRRLALEQRPDLIFFVPFENQIEWRVVGNLTASGVPTVAWMCDDHWRWANFSRHIAAQFSAVVTTDRHAFAAYHALPGVCPILSQWGVHAGRLGTPESIRDIPVSFVGARRPHRARMIEALRASGIEVVVRGSGWTEGRASTEEAASIPARSRISLNFSDSSQRHRKGSTQLKARPFELAGSGTCVVTESDPQLRYFYDMESEVVVADSPADMVRAVQWLLDDEPVRLARAQAAWARTVREHTYDVRLTKILDLLGITMTIGAEVETCITS